MSSGPDLVREAREEAASPRPARERLCRLVSLAARARDIEDPARRREAEVAIWRIAQPLLEADERPVRAQAPAAEPMGAGGLAHERLAASARTARRRALVPSSVEVPVVGPRWASRVLDAGTETLGVHVDTGAVYPLALWHDLDPEASAAIVAGRLARRGFDAEAIRVVLEAAEVPAYARRRVLEAVGGEG